MKVIHYISNFIKKETVLFAALVLAAVSCFFRAARQSLYRLYRFPNACDFVLPYGGYGGFAENRRF